MFQVNFYYLFPEKFLKLSRTEQILIDERMDSEFLYLIGNKSSINRTL